MAKSEPAIDPKNQDSILRKPTLETIEDHRGPIIYDVTLTPSLNGMDPNFEKKEGV